MAEVQTSSKAASAATVRRIADVDTLVFDYLEDLVESNRDFIESHHKLALSAAATACSKAKHNIMHILQPYVDTDTKNITQTLVDGIVSLLRDYTPAANLQVIWPDLTVSIGDAPDQDVKRAITTNNKFRSSLSVEIRVQFVGNLPRESPSGLLSIMIYRPSTPAEHFAVASYQRAFGTAPYVISAANGRVNLIGEHTDYNDGFMLPTATPQKTYVTMGLAAVGSTGNADEQPRHRVHAHSLGGEMAEFAASSATEASATPPPPAPGTFTSYICGCIRLLEQKLGIVVPPLNMWVSTELPIGAGLSSSAALEVATLRALRDLLGLRQSDAFDDVALALLAQQAEVQFAGVRCGVMDQMASSLADTTSMLFLDARSLDHHTAPLPEGSELVVIDTGYARTLAASKYNERCAECELACRALGAASLRQAGDELLLSLSKSSHDADSDNNEDKNTISSYYELVAEALRKKALEAKETPNLFADQAEAERVMRRARHVITENMRVTEACRVTTAANGNASDTCSSNDSTKEGDRTTPTITRERFGQLMNASHKSLREDYEVTVEALDIMCDALRAQPGALGARMTGAGFGGACVALFVEGTGAKGATAALEAYHQQVGDRGWKGSILVPSHQ